MTSKQFRAALAKLEISQRGFAKLIGAKSERTARRWALDESEIPDCVAIVLRLMLAGKITIDDVRAAQGT